MEIIELMALKKYFVRDTGSCRLEERNRSHASRNQLELDFTFLLFFFCQFPVSKKPYGQEARESR